ncbi:hypothetical protein COU76_03255 [Candidatus Peregrinibacteria bacterium CG10_big_fil_rev_8_21_14_0_10_49_10]|nr:MAG: hypothetical protein COU76_03255 [Candidatus Peregrinibacteria bacterium CG10_big_fil_rev_8_21_14_0_10_49_10]
MQHSVSSLLKQHGLRDTQSRRLVLHALVKGNKPLSQKEVYETIKRTDGSINLVTVYRILEKLEELGMVHRHLSSGGFVLCSLEGHAGHHVFLSCQDCGKVEECADPELCRHEDRIARSAGFIPKTHLSELLGLCSSCHTR